MPAPRKWTDADNSYLRKVWTDPAVHRDEIAKHLGKTIDTVRMQAKRLGLGGRPRGKASHEWPDDHREHAKAEWVAGLSADAIAKSLRRKFGAAAVYSRAAVLAQCITRLGLARHSPASHLTSKPKPKPEKVFKVGQGNVVFVQSPQVAPVSPARAEAFKPLEGFEPVRWTERGRGCAWPLETPPGEDMLSCGAARSKGDYCAFHNDLRSAPTGSTKELMRGLRRIA